MTTKIIKNIFNLISVRGTFRFFYTHLISNNLTNCGNCHTRICPSRPPVAISVPCGLIRTIRCNGSGTRKSVCIESPGLMSNFNRFVFALESPEQVGIFSIPKNIK